MPVTVNINAVAIKEKMDAAKDKCIPILASQVLADCNEYCKEDNGILIASSLIKSELDKGLLVWETPYAARQYYEIQTAYKDKNPNASWRWCEVAKNNHLERWVEQAQALKRYYG